MKYICTCTTATSKYMKTSTITTSQKINNNLSNNEALSIMTLIADFDFEIETGNIDWDGETGEDSGVSMNYSLNADVEVVFDYELYFNPQYNSCLVDKLDIYIKDEKHTLSNEMFIKISGAVESNINKAIN